MKSSFKWNIQVDHKQDFSTIQFAKIGKEGSCNGRGKIDERHNCPRMKHIHSDK